MSKQKLYGRVHFNKLDVLLGIVCAVIALGSLWLSIGVAIGEAADAACWSWMDIARAFGLAAGEASDVRSAVVSAYSGFIIYGSFLLLILGSIYLARKGLKDRIPGLVAELVAAIGFSCLMCFIHEYARGHAAESVNAFWPFSAILFLVILVCLAVYAVYATFNTKINIYYSKELEEEKEAEEEIIENQQPEEVVEEPVPAPVEEPEEEEEVEEEIEVEEEAEEEDVEEAEEEAEEGAEAEPGYKSLGKRRKRIPFENKLKKVDKDTRDRYKEIVKSLEEYNFSNRMSIPGHTFNYKRERLVFITISGTTLKVYFKLNPNDYIDSPIPAKDASDTKKFEDIPLFLKIKSDLAVKRVAKLVDDVAQKYNVEKKA